MPNYEMHVWFAQKVGIFISILFFIISIIYGLIFTSLTLISLLASSALISYVSYRSTLIGGVIPDIDQSRPSSSLKTSSIPYRILVGIIKFLLVILILILSLSVVEKSKITIQILGTLFTVIVLIVGVRLVPDVLHYIMPPHRKLTHRPSFWFVMGIFTVFLTDRILQMVDIHTFVQTLLPLAIGIPVFVGVVTHTSMDTVSDYVRDYAPDPVKRQAMKLQPWVPKHKPIIADIPRLARIAFDSRAPLSIRIFVVFTFAYGMMPYDLINSFIPIIGWIDDLFIYLMLRDTVYRGYNQDIGFKEAASREIQWTVIQGMIFIVLVIATIISIFIIV